MNAPINDRIAVHVLKGETEMSADSLCVHAVSLPSDQVHPRIVTVLGHITVFGADKVNPFSCSLAKTKVHLFSKSCMVFAPKHLSRHQSEQQIQLEHNHPIL